MTDWLGATVTSGTLVLAIPIALLAGLVSFFSPCVMPLLPGYLSYITGLSVTDLDSGRRGRMLAGSILFVLGPHPSQNVQRERRECEHDDRTGGDWGSRENQADRCEDD